MTAMEATTTRALAQAFVEAIHGIAPRYPHAKSSRWKYTPGGRDRGARHLLGASLRSFDLIWDPGAATFAWFGSGEAYGARLRIGVSYCGAPPQELEHMITADGVDLRRVLIALSEPTSPGLSTITELGVQLEEIDDIANGYVEFGFFVNWAQDTDAQ